MIIKNFSRHPFNTDQKALLEKAGYEYTEQVLSPLLSLDAIMEEIQCCDFSLSYEVPLFIALRLAKNYLARDMIVWDYIVREKRFAVKGLSVFNPACDFRLKYLLSIMPTVENDIKTGIEFPFGEEEKTLWQAYLKK